MYELLNQSKQVMNFLSATSTKGQFLRTVKAGFQINYNYSNLILIRLMLNFYSKASLKPSSVALKDQYYFDCNCETCFTKDKDVVKTAYIMPEEDVPAKTVNFITKNTEIMLKKIDSSKKVQAWERVAKQAGGLLMQQENLFDDTHLKVSHASKMQK